MKKNIMGIVFLLPFFCIAQNTLTFPKNGESGTANLGDVSWMEGHWKGEAFGGMAEEIWSPPLGDTMMFVFKHVVDGKVNFYEIGHFRQLGETLVFELKHFHSDLKGWEKKEEVLQFKFIKKEGNRAYFDRFTFERIDKDTVTIYALIDRENGTMEEVQLNYKRV